MKIRNTLWILAGFIFLNSAYAGERKFEEGHYVAVHFVQKQDILPYLGNMMGGVALATIRSRLGYITNLHEEKVKVYEKYVEVALDGNLLAPRSRRASMGGVRVSSFIKKEVTEIKLAHTYALVVDDNFHLAPFIKELKDLGYKNAESINDSVSFLVSDASLLNATVRGQESGKGGVFRKHIHKLKKYPHCSLVHNIARSVEIYDGHDILTDVRGDKKLQYLKRKKGNIKVATIPASESDGACFAGALFDWVRKPEYGIAPALFNRSFSADGVFGLKATSIFYSVKVKVVGDCNAEEHEALVILVPDSPEVLLIEKLPDFNKKYDGSGVLVVEEEKEVSLLETSQTTLSEIAQQRVRAIQTQENAVSLGEEKLPESMKHLKITSQSPIALPIALVAGQHLSQVKSVVSDDDKSLNGSNAVEASHGQNPNMVTSLSEPGRNLGMTHNQGK